MEMTRKERLAKQKKVLIALSGGIDSAVSAVLLLRRGYYVEGAFMKNWSSAQGLLQSDCPWLEDRREALKVAAYLGIVLHTFDFEKEYRANVIRHFFDAYASGKTPNPDVMCNREIKFRLLYEKAMSMGFDYLATGHYARIHNGGGVNLRESGANGSGLLRADFAAAESAPSRAALLRSKDEFKDQTYFIYNLKPDQLGHLLFPVGNYLKQEVREMARRFGLPNAERKESMGICFVGKIKLDEFLKQKIEMKPGPIIDISGKAIGSHTGLARYTLGQRQGLGIGGTGPYYVMRKDIYTNTLVVSRDAKNRDFLISEISVAEVNWLAKPIKFPFSCKGRFRHQQDLQDLIIEKKYIGAADSRAGEKNREEKNEVDGSLKDVRVRFKRPQHAVASGQSIVFYKRKVCLGGGVII